MEVGTSTVSSRVRLGTYTRSLLQAFVTDVGPAVQSIKAMVTTLDEDLKGLLAYFGEDPTATKPEDFFATIVSFASSLSVSDYGTRTCFQIRSLIAFHFTEGGERNPGNGSQIEDDQETGRQ